MLSNNQKISETIEKEVGDMTHKKAMAATKKNSPASFTHYKHYFIHE
jgi:hypothetical protein